MASRLLAAPSLSTTMWGRLSPLLGTAKQANKHNNELTEGEVKANTVFVPTTVIITTTGAGRLRR
jgi:hypothetical protein